MLEHQQRRSEPAIGRCAERVGRRTIWRYIGRRRRRGRELGSRWNRGHWRCGFRAALRFRSVHSDEMCRRRLWPRRVLPRPQRTRVHSWRLGLPHFGRRRRGCQRRSSNGGGRDGCWEVLRVRGARCRGHAFHALLATSTGLRVLLLRHAAVFVLHVLRRGWGRFGAVPRRLTERASKEVGP